MSHYSKKSCKSRTEAIMHVPQIVTYVVVNKGTGHKGALRRTKVTPLCMHSSCCGWQKACRRTKRQQTLKKSGL